MTLFKNYLDNEITALQSGLPVLHATIGTSSTNFAEGTLQQVYQSALSETSSVIGMTMNLGPAKIAPGGIVAYLPIDAPASGITSLAYLELDIANAAYTEFIQFFTPGPTTIPPGVTSNINLDQWGPAAHQIGTDLVMDIAGRVKTTAGGIFWVTVVIELTAIPNP